MKPIEEMKAEVIAEMNYGPTTRETFCVILDHLADHERRLDALDDPCKPRPAEPPPREIKDHEYLRHDTHVNIREAYLQAYDSLSAYCGVEQGWDLIYPVPIYRELDDKAKMPDPMRKVKAQMYGIDDKPAEPQYVRVFRLMHPDRKINRFGNDYYADDLNGETAMLIDRADQKPEVALEWIRAHCKQHRLAYSICRVPDDGCNYVVCFHKPGTGWKSPFGDSFSQDFCTALLTAIECHHERGK